MIDGHVPALTPVFTGDISFHSGDIQHAGGKLKNKRQGNVVFMRKSHLICQDATGLG